MKWIKKNQITERNLTDCMNLQQLVALLNWNRCISSKTNWKHCLRDISVVLPNWKCWWFTLQHFLKIFLKWWLFLDGNKLRTFLVTLSNWQCYNSLKIHGNVIQLLLEMVRLLWNNERLTNWEEITCTDGESVNAKFKHDPRFRIIASAESLIEQCKCIDTKLSE